MATEIDSFETVANDSSLWEKVPVDKAHFSKDVLLGTATSEYQYSGQINCPNNQWAEWKKNLPHNQQSGKARDLWSGMCSNLKKPSHGHVSLFSRMEQDRARARRL